MAQIIIHRTAAASTGKVVIVNNLTGIEATAVRAFVPGTLFATGLAGADNPIAVNIMGPEDDENDEGTPLVIGGTAVQLTADNVVYKVTSVMQLRIIKPATAGLVGVYFSEQSNP